MIAARPLPAVKPEHPGVFAPVQIPIDLKESRPLRLTDALSAVAGQRFDNDETPPSRVATLGPRGATFTQATRGACGGAGGSQP